MPVKAREVFFIVLQILSRRPSESRDDGDHGIAKRSVLPPLDISTGAKPVTARPRVPQSPCSLISNLLSRVQSSLVPPQFNGFSLNFSVRFFAFHASAELKTCLDCPRT